MKTILKMNQHAKLHKASYQSTSKWWILAAAISLLLVAIFVGLVVFLGISNEIDTKTTTYNQRDPSVRFQDKRRSNEVQRKREEQVRKVLEEDVKKEQEARVEEVTKDFKEIRKEVESSVSEHPVEVDSTNDQSDVMPINEDDQNRDEHEAEIVPNVHSSPESLIGHEEILGSDIDSVREEVIHELQFQPSDVDPIFESAATPAEAEVRTSEEPSTRQPPHSSALQTPSPSPSPSPGPHPEPGDHYHDQMPTFEFSSELPTHATYFNNDPLQRRTLEVRNNIRENKITFFSEFKPMPKHDLKPSKEKKDGAGHSHDIYSDEFPVVSAMFDGPEHRFAHDHDIKLDDQDSILHQEDVFDNANVGPVSDGQSVGSFLNIRVQDLHNWLSTDNETQSANGSLMHDIKHILNAINSSITEGNPNILLWKLKDMYNEGANDAVLNVTDPSVLANSSSLVSVGLLAFDLLLLRSVQQIAWEDQVDAKQEMMKDPEVVAMNAMFMSPEQMRDFQDPTSRVDVDEPVKGFLEEVLAFVNSTMRAIVMLGRAYRSSVVGRKMEGKQAGEGAGNGTTMDCIWTLYCRNLDKTAKLDGLYGFLAKMNGLGLRLVMGEFPLETALDLFIKEAVQGSTRIKCEKLFPNCSPKRAAEVVMSIVRSSHARS